MDYYGRTVMKQDPGSRCGVLLVTSAAHESGATLSGLTDGPAVDHARPATLSDNQPASNTIVASALQHD
jgi:hypothetical protein